MSLALPTLATLAARSAEFDGVASTAVTMFWTSLAQFSKIPAGRNDYIRAAGKASLIISQNHAKSRNLHDGIDHA
jgi:hypothetical protein